MSPVEFRWGTWLFSRVKKVSQTSLRVVRGYSGFHSRWCRGIRPFEGEIGGLSTCGRIRGVPLEFQ